MNKCTPSRPTVVVADDHPEMLRQLSRLLQDDFDIVCAAQDGLSALRAITEHKPRLAVLDVSMPKLSGIEVVQELKKANLLTKVVFISIQSDPDYIQTMIAMGASFVSKVRIRTDLLVALGELLNGRIFVSPA